jgi:putative ABC transport system substrate-binding protein
MRQLRFAALLALVFSWAHLATAADVAVLKSADSPAWRPAIDALRRSAATHTLTEYDLKGDRAEAERVVAGLKGKPGVIVAMGPLAAQAAHDLAPEIPMVFCMVQDPAKLGLTGLNNVTGVAYAIPIKNQLAAFRLVNPRGVRIGVIYSDANTGRQVDEALKAAGVVRLNVVPKPVTSEKDVPEALRTLLKGSDAVDALWIPPDQILLGDESRRYILAETLKAAKPIYSFSAALVSEGALVSNGPDVTSIGDEVGELVNRIASGEKGKIEMLIPRAELVVNKKIADKLKIEIPADALRAANKVL